jgi:dienelactone hydrolase
MKTLSKVIWLPVFLTVFSSCIHYPSVTGTRPPQKPDKDLRDYFDYPRETVQPQIKILKRNRKYTLKEISFDLHLPESLVGKPVEIMRKEVEEKRRNHDTKGADDLELEYTVKIDYYQVPGETRRPLIVISPILGGNMIVDWFAAYFASQGMHAAIVHRRKPRYDSSRDLGQVEDVLRKSVLRTRQALDWLLENPGIDSDKVGSFGISYGGLVNTLTAAVEPRIRCHIFAMAGGPLADLILDSKEKAIQKYIRAAAEQTGHAPEKLRAELQNAIHSDTLKMAAYLRSYDVLMVIAFFDQVVGRKYSQNLWRALGRPEVIYTPFGHYGTLLTLPYLKSKARQFYQARFYPEKGEGNAAGSLLMQGN